MSIKSQEFIGNYRKLKDCTGIEYGMQPKRLNPNDELYGTSPPALDLNGSFKEEGPGEKLESILMFIEEYARRQGSNCLKDVLGCDFVSTRNLLVAIAMSAHDNEKVSFQAVRHKDVIFLCRIEKESSAPDPPQSIDLHNSCKTTFKPAKYLYNGNKKNKITVKTTPKLSPQERKAKRIAEQLHKGLKFAQYMTLDDEGNENTFQTKVSNDICEKVVLKTEIEKKEESFKLFYGAEIDAMDKDGSYVELKTYSGDDEYWYKNRSLKAYLQPYFGNVPTVLIGHHKDGIVFKISKIETSEIPTMSEEIKWKPEECLDRLFNVLDQVAFALNKNGMEKLYEYKPKKKIFKESEVKDFKFVGKEFLENFV